MIKKDQSTHSSVQSANLSDGAETIADWQIETMSALADAAFATKAFETELVSREPDPKQTIHLRDRCATPMLLNEWREITRDDVVIAEVWQRAAASVVKRDPDFSDTDADAVRELAKETRATARAWLSEVAQAWLGSEGAEWVTGANAWPRTDAVPDGKGGVPAVSLALAEFIEKFDLEKAKGWIEVETEHATEQIAQLPLWAEDQPFALPGWFVSEGSKIVQEKDGKTFGLWRVMTARNQATPAATTLALAVWNHRVHRQLLETRDREERTKIAALVLPLAVSLSKLSGAVTVDADGTVRARDTDTGLIVTPSVPAVDLELARAIIDSADLHTLHAQRTFLWCSRVAWLAYVHGGEATGENWHARIQFDGSVHVEVSGGETGLAKAVGVTAHNVKERVVETIRAFTRLCLSGPHGDDLLDTPLASEYRRTRGNHIRKGQVSFTLSTWWSVGAVRLLKKQGRRRVLVPTVGLPPMDGIAECYQPALASMERAAIVELASKSRELVKYGSVKVDWHRLGADRGLDQRVVDSALTKWYEQDRWQRHGSGHRLGKNDEVKSAYEMLIEGGSRSEKGSQDGKVSADLVRKRARLKQAK